MKIKKNLAVTIEYTLTDGDKNVIDTTDGNTPMTYLHGHQNILPALENALDGKEAGDSFKITVEPDDAYGERDESLTSPVPREDLQDVEGLQVGGFVEAETENEVVIFRVLEINDDNVILDGNHPLAGATLHFDVSIKEIREATDEEIAHGHIHDDEHEHH